MNVRILPFALFTALVVVASPVAAGDATASVKPVRVEVVGPDTLAGIRGKFYGANMLVGLRIELASKWNTAQGAVEAGGTLQIQRQGNGYDVQVDTHSSADANGAQGTLAANASATGGDQVATNGIGQVTQIAGDGNRHSNVTTISFAPQSQAGGSFNGQSSSTSSDNGMVAKISFDAGAINLGLSSQSGYIGQSIGTGGSDSAMQVARITGNDQGSSNMMQLQVLTDQMSLQSQHALGIEQAMSGMLPITR